MNNSFIRFSLFLSLYLLIQFSFNLATVSILTSLHFQLNHDMATIETWLFSNAWQVSTLVKGCSFFLMWKILNSRSDIDLKILDVAKNFIKGPDRRPATIIVVFYLCFFTFGSLQSKDQIINDFSLLWVFLGQIILFIPDLILLRKYFDFDNNEIEHKTLSYLILFVFFYLSILNLFPYKGAQYFFFSTLWVLTCSMTFFKGNLTNALIFVAFIICPFATVLPFDIVYAQKISLLQLSDSITQSFLSVLSVLLIFYTFWVGKQRLID